GEAERSAPLLVQGLAERTERDLAALPVPGLLTPGQTAPPLPVAGIDDLDGLPFPAWDLFPLENYWSLGFGHGPLTGRRYLPLLTSRGCPYPCAFCVIPATNGRRWRARSGASVALEMASMGDRFGVAEFHLEDVNPTVNDRRTREMCQAILERDLRVTWKLAAGTKVESIRDGETIALMARAGCRYISISPETGAPELLKTMGKPFKRDHAAGIVAAMNRHGIRSQACFVLGFPGEGDAQRRATWNMVEDLTRMGVDEIALFIITPVPGSAIFAGYSGYGSLSDLNFTPSWREDYRLLVDFRLALYKRFLWWKLRYHPWKLLRQCGNFLIGRFETKMEMVPYKALVWWWVEHQPGGRCHPPPLDMQP
ncbi:MAG: B12-binding domain-containing radical SAM protein, partial [Magnetococcales bacterium]|nr:B12-binding domain-containing radical SAM protein [Magnetococcales bacterium]